MWLYLEYCVTLIFYDITHAQGVNFMNYFFVACYYFWDVLGTKITSICVGIFVNVVNYCTIYTSPTTEFILYGLNPYFSNWLGHGVC